MLLWQVSPFVPPQQDLASPFTPCLAPDRFGIEPLTLKGMDNLLKVKGGGALPQDLDAKVTSGALEQSNVNMTQALVDMIENQRSYEVQAKLLSTAKDMDEGGASVMRMPG